MSSIISTFIPEIIIGKDYNDYMENIFPTLPVIADNKLSMIDQSIIHADEGGYWLEFGVHSGETITHTAGRKLGVPNLIIHGFDSFEGLPEDWLQPETGHTNLKGHFDLDGKIPQNLLCVQNINIIKGWFDKSLPKYFKGHCVVYFDEFCNYPGGENGEYKAFSEFLHNNKDNIEKCIPIGIGMPHGFSVASFVIKFKE